MVPISWLSSVFFRTGGFACKSPLTYPQQLPQLFFLRDLIFFYICMLQNEPQRIKIVCRNNNEARELVCNICVEECPMERTVKRKFVGLMRRSQEQCDNNDQKVTLSLSFQARWCYKLWTSRNLIIKRPESPFENGQTLFYRIQADNKR